MTRPVLTLLTALALLWQAMTGLPPAHAAFVAAPICHGGDGQASVPAGVPHDCLLCPICVSVAQAAMLLPPTPWPPHAFLVAAVVVAFWSERSPTAAKTWTSWPRGPPRTV